MIPRKLLAGTKYERKKSSLVVARGVPCPSSLLASGNRSIVVKITTFRGSMEKTIPAADANRKFSELLRGVRKGRRYVVTSHGKPVAKLVPADVDDRAMESSRLALFERLQSQKPVGGDAPRRWKREELYEDSK